MTLTFRPSRLSGSIDAPPSKSVSHRFLICASLSKSGTSSLNGIGRGEDIEATRSALTALGAVIADRPDGSVFVDGSRIFSGRSPVCFCGESGSTLRFLIPLLSLAGGGTLIRRGSLIGRPLDEYAALFAERGIAFSASGEEVKVGAGLGGGEYRVPGERSSQFISGLLFALPLAERDSTVIITGGVNSRPYIDLTLSALRRFGIDAGWADAGFSGEAKTALSIPGRQKYRAADAAVEGDHSLAANFSALRLLGGDITVTGLDGGSVQGDRVFGEYAQKIALGRPTLDLRGCPDLAPLLFALAAVKNGADFTGCARLRYKESDRVLSMRTELEKLGAEIAADGDRVTVRPAESFGEKTADFISHGDHRAAMALSVLLCFCGGTLRRAEAVNKSMPDFFDRLRALGAEITEI